MCWRQCVQLFAERHVYTFKAMGRYPAPSSFPVIAFALTSAASIHTHFFTGMLVSRRSSVCHFQPPQRLFKSASYLLSSHQLARSVLADRSFGSGTNKYVKVGLSV